MTDDLVKRLRQPIIHTVQIKELAEILRYEAADRIEQLEAALDELLTYQVASEAAARNVGELTKIMQKHRVLLEKKYDK